MATPKKSKAMRRPAPAGREERADAPSPAVVSGAAAPLRVVPPPVVPDPEVPERAVRRRFTAEYKLQVLRQADPRGGGGGGLLVGPEGVAPEARAGRAARLGSEEARPADGAGVAAGPPGGRAAAGQRAAGAAAPPSRSHHRGSKKNLPDLGPLGPPAPRSPGAAGPGRPRGRARGHGGR